MLVSDYNGELYFYGEQLVLIYTEKGLTKNLILDPSDNVRVGACIGTTLLSDIREKKSVGNIKDFVRVFERKLNE